MNTATRLTQPGAWSVVRARLRHDTSGWSWEWVRHPAGYWFNDFGTRADWPDLIDPEEVVTR